MTGKKNEVRTPEETQIEVPLDIALSLLTPKERAKLRNYVLYGSTFYQASNATKEEAYAILAKRHAISIDHIKARLQDQRKPFMLNSVSFLLVCKQSHERGMPDFTLVAPTCL